MDKVAIYNNTAYSPDTGSNFMFVGIDSTITNVTVKNNLGYAPNDSQHAMISGTGASGFSASNNSSNAQVQSTNPNFTTTPPTQPSHWKPTSGYAVGGATPVPVWSDFFRVAEPSSRDIGAVVH